VKAAVCFLFEVMVFLYIIYSLVLMAGCKEVACTPTGEFAYQQRSFGGRYGIEQHGAVKVQKMQCSDDSTQYWEFQ
jgi:hypothetical protein